MKIQIFAEENHFRVKHTVYRQSAVSPTHNIILTLNESYTKLKRKTS